MPEDNKYPNYITRGLGALNDQIFDYLKPRIKGSWLDVGTNVGVLLSEVPNGVGVDAGLSVVEDAKSRGLDVRHADACDLPFPDNSFDTVVLSCVLEQIELWQNAVDEALRVCKSGGKVIGINPIKEVTLWGQLGGTEWVKSVIDEEDLKIAYKAVIHYPSIEGKYYFEIRKT